MALAQVKPARDSKGHFLPKAKVDVRQAAVNAVIKAGECLGVVVKMNKEFKIDPSKGGMDGTVSGQWMSRPDDQKFLNLAVLEKHVRARGLAMVEETVLAKDVEVMGDDSSNSIVVSTNGGKILTPTNYVFGSIAYQAGAPATYLRTLPASLAARCINEGLRKEAEGEVKLFHNGDQLRGVTSATYGRIYDADLVSAVRKIAGDGVGDTRWKVPGMIDWSKGTYNPYVDISKDTTTLYASDRDVFLFLVDDTHPIEIGKLADGSPDYVFRGFYVWNSEVGARSMGISTFLLRGVCCNRNLWGVEDQLTMTIRHTKFAPERFVEDFNKTLVAYSTSSAAPIVAKVEAAKKLILVKTDEQRAEFFSKLGLTRAQAKAAATRGLEEEGHMPVSAWDLTQCLTALARYTSKTDERVMFERKADVVMGKVVA